MATSVNLSSTDRPSSWPRYSINGPSTTQAMKLTSKYKNAANNVGQCPALLNSRQFMLLSVKPGPDAMRRHNSTIASAVPIRIPLRSRPLDMQGPFTLHQIGE